MAKTFSGKQVVKILCKYFGFFIVSQKGSHIKLKKTIDNKMITAIVPMHKELARGTFRGILELAQIKVEEFFKHK